MNKIRNFFNPAKDTAIILAVALFLRVIYMLLMTNQYTSLVILHLLDDSQTYIDVAKYFLGINAGGGDDLLLTGPGYGFLLAVIFKLFGFGAWAVLILQIILSGLSCLIIYKIAQLLLNNRTVSLIAGLLAATSLTSISLANAVLTDSIFFFLFSLAIYIYLTGLKTNRWKDFVICGVLLGVATLIRSIGLFLPIVLVALIFILPLESMTSSKKALLLKSVVAGLLLIIVALPWAFKNKAEFGIFTISETGTLAARNYLVSRIIYEEEESGSLMEIRDRMASPKMVGDRPETPLERHEDAVRKIKMAFGKYPGAFIRVFFRDIWENITTLSTIHGLQVPQLRSWFEIYTDKIFTKGRSSLTFFLSIIGFVLLCWGNRIRVALALALIYLYFALLSGFTFWQGSRIFYPGQVAWAILIAFAFDRIYYSMQKLVHYLRTNF